MSRRPSYIVGIDFGTTYSGIAWALEGSENEIQVVSTWHDRNHRTFAKVPSVISYHGNARPKNWGYQVDLSTEGFRGFKLLLDEAQELAYIPSLASVGLLGKYNKTVEQVTADYLERLVNYAKQVMFRDRLLPDDANLKLRYVLTVPAVWSDKAKDRTIDAAIQAGLPAEDVSLISEPEAAALHALRKVLPDSFTENDVFIVCDAGGGTVDLIAYRIKALEPLELVEVTEGTGRACGSMFLDERFEALIRARMGAEKYDSLSNASKDAVRSHWQNRVKPYYKGKLMKQESPSDSEDSATASDDEFADTVKWIPVAGAADSPAIVGGCFPLSVDDIEGIFEPIVGDVEELVSGQVASIRKLGLSVKAIVLVGGFGSSPCLFRRLNRGYPAVRILQPEDAWSAVVRGAVHHGLLGNHVEHRIARRHYGLRCGVYWVAGVHEAHNRYWDSLEEVHMATEMGWLIRKSSPMYESQPIKLDLCSNVRVEEADTALLFPVRLYFCNDAVAPETRDHRSKELCTLEADLTRIPRALFPKRCNSKGVEYYRIPFTIVMIPASSLIFELRFGGVPYGSVQSKYS